jgi:hypothetical protein
MWMPSFLLLNLVWRHSTQSHLICILKVYSKALSLNKICDEILSQDIEDRGERCCRRNHKTKQVATEEVKHNQRKVQNHQANLWCTSSLIKRTKIWWEQVEAKDQITLLETKAACKCVTHANATMAQRRNWKPVLGTNGRNISARGEVQKCNEFGTVVVQIVNRSVENIAAGIQKATQPTQTLAWSNQLLPENK